MSIDTIELFLQIICVIWLFYWCVTMFAIRYLYNQKWHFAPAGIALNAVAIAFLIATIMT